MPAKQILEERKLFHEFLRRNGLKKTRQKDLILETFLGHEGHLSVEDIYALVKKKDKKVGIVTVFRTLKSLTTCGIAREIGLGDGLTRFEHCYHHPLHHHIICNKCQKVIEFTSPELEKVQRSIVMKYGFQQLQQRIQIYGLCQECLEQRPIPAHPEHDTGKVFARDALRLALSLRRQDLEFYRSAATRNQNPAGREVLEVVAMEEESHASQLNAELEAMHRNEKGLEIAPEFLHFDTTELKQLIPSLQDFMVGEELRLDACHALEMSMQLEKRTARFFQQLAEKFDETEGRRVLERCAEQELRHYASISHRAQAMKSASF